MVSKAIPLSTLQVLFQTEMAKADEVSRRVSAMDDDNLSFHDVSETTKDLSRIMGKLDILQLILSEN